MKNIIPFKKDVIFKTNLSEITSISLENTLNIIDNSIKGEFIINGDYKISDNSKTVEPFDIKLPFEIMIDEKYDSSSATIDIDDFYYEIVNNNVLSVSIDVLIDKLKDKPIIEFDDLSELEEVRNIVNIEEDNKDIIEEIKEEKIDNRICKVEKEDVSTKDESNDVNSNREDISSIFDMTLDSKDSFSTYNVYIIRQGDNIDSIIEKYNVTIEELKEYNDLSDIKLGDKIIIPCNNERN